MSTIIYFDEVQADCPDREKEIDTARAVHVCARHESGSRPPCCAPLCPIFESVDEDGDIEFMREANEIEGVRTESAPTLKGESDVY